MMITFNITSLVTLNYPELFQISWYVMNSLTLMAYASKLRDEYVFELDRENNSSEKSLHENSIIVLYAAALSSFCAVAPLTKTYPILRGGIIAIGLLFAILVNFTDVTVSNKYFEESVDEKMGFYYPVLLIAFGAIVLAFFTLSHRFRKILTRNIDVAESETVQKNKSQSETIAPPNETVKKQE